ncbi:type I-E CRISPR-associated protein Cse1/CasA [Leptolyngbya sp. FACHB-321]|uniref:type I-E CRISPR-associated protein Cse1/CasA n=1 Tax=Leptolyngbya sp. FACHB-321 TaxID=2692807 RepID=UPI001688610A|nr:type I-E CRISPR-associated protein Cse1/CasA [Leptolyngbya sp. FACHB-321]MBD2037763.1 type I-E CRISPR-associated protein Cse1/CasA [Leptolyngbya sp. FACHB-321]
MSYSLLTEPWIPARQGGEVKSIGLLQLFQSWNSLHDLCAANPPRQIALYRFLIAIAHAAFRGPATTQEYKALWVDRQLGDRICEYLNQWANRFDLLHPDRPFLQDVRIATTIGQTPIGKAIYQDANTPIIWFKPSDTPWLALPDATQELLRMQSLELGGRKSDSITAGPGRWTQGRHVFPIGSSLRDTLLLNLSGYEASDIDQPVWEKDTPYGIGERHPAGYLDWLTYCERRILLTMQGDKVTHLRLASGWKLPTGSSSTYDQHQAFRLLSKGQVWLPLLFNPQRQLWDDSEAILHTIEDNHYRPKIFDWLSNNRKLLNPQPVRVLGFAHAGGTNTAKPLHWADDSLAVPESILEDADIWQWIEGAITWARHFGQVFTGKTLSYAPSPLNRGERDTILAQLPSLQAALYGYIGQQFPGLLLDLADADRAQTRLQQWQTQLATYSKQLVSPLITALPDYRSKAITEQMFKTAIRMANP